MTFLFLFNLFNLRLILLFFLKGKNIIPFKNIIPTPKNRLLLFLKRGLEKYRFFAVYYRINQEHNTTLVANTIKNIFLQLKYHI